MGDLLTAALAIVSIATLAGLGLQRGVVTNLRENLRDSREAEQAERTRRQTAESDLTVCKSDLAAIGRLATGEAHWVALGQQLEEHHESAERHWAETTTALQAIVSELQRGRT